MVQDLILRRRIVDEGFLPGIGWIKAGKIDTVVGWPKSIKPAVVITVG